MVRFAGSFGRTNRHLRREKEGAFGDLTWGVRVRAAFEVREGRRVATMVEVRPPGEAAPPAKAHCYPRADRRRDPRARAGRQAVVEEIDPAAWPALRVCPI